ncbi:hypothetical protein BBP40_000932 [Aspergillus hancockii]|nr:hypothetical protein BBP40_000932 [Aspergillus hancockii]
MSTIGTRTASPTSSDIRLDETNRLRESFKAYEECMQGQLETVEEETVRLRSEVESLEMQLHNTIVALSCQAEETGGLMALNEELSDRVGELDVLLRQRHSNIAELKPEGNGGDTLIKSLQAEIKQRDILVKQKDTQINILQAEVDEYEDRLAQGLKRNATLKRALSNAKKRIKELEKPQQTHPVRGGRASRHAGNVKIKSFWHLFYLLWH